ncbi:MAG: hypothetical protein ACFFG0_15045 [Candidatus Thorarchaeota archaeon]
MESLEREPESYFEAIKTAKERHMFRRGVFYRTQRPKYHKELYRDHYPIESKPSVNEIIEKIRKIFESK